MVIPHGEAGRGTSSRRRGDCLGPEGEDGWERGKGISLEPTSTLMSCCFQSIRTQRQLASPHKERDTFKESGEEERPSSTSVTLPLL